jgi:hypothetical protein
LEKVERGERTADRVGDLLKIATVLKIGLGDLIGGVALPPNGGGQLDLPGGVHAIRRAILSPTLPDREPPPAVELRAIADEVVREQYDNARVEPVVRLLPAAITAGRIAVAQNVPGASWCLAVLYQNTATLARGLVQGPLEWIAAREALAAAQASGDELLVAAARRSVAFALLHEGWLDEVLSYCSDAADALAPSDKSPAAAWSMWGSLHLTAAVAAARADKRPVARRLLGDARDAADRVGPGRNDYWWAFSPANVGAHEVSVAVEFEDATEALWLAKQVNVDEMANNERAATYLLEVARAHLMRQDKGSRSVCCWRRNADRRRSFVTT